jgi:hypothetical protein
MSAPGYWMHEESGVLRPVVVAYLKDQPLTDAQIAVMRSYLRQWITANVWVGPAIAELRRRIDGLTSRQAIADWLDDAIDLGIDPL